MNRYTAMPHHVLFPMATSIAGALLLKLDGYQWVIIGLAVCLFSFFTWAWIIYVGITRERIEYWDTITHAVNQLNKTNNPEVWQALGFTIPKDKAEVVIHKETKEEEKIGIKKVSNRTLPISSAKLYTFASAVLNGKSLSYSTWGGKNKLFTDIKYREFHKYLRAQKWIERSNPEHGRQGYQLTETGRLVFEEIVGGVVHHKAPGATTSLLDNSLPRLQA